MRSSQELAAAITQSEEMHQCLTAKQIVMNHLVVISSCNMYDLMDLFKEDSNPWMLLQLDGVIVRRIMSFMVTIVDMWHIANFFVVFVFVHHNESFKYSSLLSVQNS